MSRNFKEGYLHDTGDKRNGSKHCKWCGNQIPRGFKCYHGEDVPVLLKRINKLEMELRKNRISIPA